MEGSWLLLLIAVFLDTVSLFCQVFFAVMLADLESDFMGPIEACRRVNGFIVPEALFHAATTAVFLVAGYWRITLLNAPLVLYNAYKISQDRYKLSPTDVFRKMPGYKRECYTKMAFHVILFFGYLFASIAMLITEEAKWVPR